MRDLHCLLGLVHTVLKIKNFALAAPALLTFTQQYVQYFPSSCHIFYYPCHYWQAVIHKTVCLSQYCRQNIDNILFLKNVRTSMLVVRIVCPGHFRAMCLVSVSEKALTATIKDSPSQAIENNQRFQESDDWKSLLLGTVDQDPTSPLDKSSLCHWLREL